MFCGKCGAQNADNTKFCKNCGAKLKNGAPATNDKNRKVGMIAVAVAVVVVIILGVVLFGGRSYKATVEKYVDAQFDANAEAIFDLMPKKMIDYALEEEGHDSDDLDDLIEDANENIQDYLDTMDEYLGEDWKVSYEIIDTEDIKGDDLDEIKDSYEDADVEVSAAKEVELEITVKADEKEQSFSMDISLIKVGRSWYLDVMSMENLF